MGLFIQLISEIQYFWFRFLPESPQFYVASNKIDKARQIIVKGARVNRMQFNFRLKPSIDVNSTEAVGVRIYTPLDLVRTPRMRLYFFMVSWLWLEYNETSTQGYCEWPFSNNIDLSKVTVTSIKWSTWHFHSDRGISELLDNFKLTLMLVKRSWCISKTTFYPLVRHWSLGAQQNGRFEARALQPNYTWFWVSCSFGYLQLDLPILFSSSKKCEKC